jgi:hypothetical protein
MFMSWKPIALLLLVLPVFQCGGSGEAEDSVGPGRTIDSPITIDESKVPAALVFDGEDRLQFEDDAEDRVFNFNSTGTIDLMFCPSEPTAVEGDGDLRFSQALVSCADDDARGTRYGIYLLGDLDGLGFWNGQDWWSVDYEFEPNAWVHLTVVFHRGWTVFAVNGRAVGVLRAPLGRPVDPQDRTGQTQRICSTYIGATRGGRNAFLGHIAWIRSWRAPLSMGHVARLPAIVGIPEDPVLAQALAACSDFRAESRDMQRSSRATRAALALQARAGKAELKFAKSIPWRLDLETAKQDAVSSGLPILAWSTRGDMYDAATLALEGGLLNQQLWDALGESFVPLLLVASLEQPAPAGVPAASCALLDSEGRVLRRFVPWTADFAKAIAKEVQDLAAAPAGNAQRARQLLMRPAVSLSAAQLGELAALAERERLPAELHLRIEDAQQVARIVALQERYQLRAALALEGAAPEPFERAQALYHAKALELFEALKLPLEPDVRLADFAVLLWRGLVDDPRLDVAQDAADFLVPMRALDPVVDAVMTSDVIAFEADQDELQRILRR